MSTASLVSEFQHRHIGPSPQETAEMLAAVGASSLDELMAQMTAGRFRHLPVVEDGALVGIISIGDVVKRKIEETEQEAMALREYIASA